MLIKSKISVKHTVTAPVIQSSVMLMSIVIGYSSFQGGGCLGAVFLVPVNHSLAVLLP